MLSQHCTGGHGNTGGGALGAAAGPHGDPRLFAMSAAHSSSRWRRRPAPSGAVQGPTSTTLPFHEKPQHRHTVPGRIHVINLGIAERYRRAEATSVHPQAIPKKHDSGRSHHPLHRRAYHASDDKHPGRPLRTWHNTEVDHESHTAVETQRQGNCTNVVAAACFRQPDSDCCPLLHQQLSAPVRCRGNQATRVRQTTRIVE